ncbi:alpha/beta fold hydrolase [Actinosynnema sp.]|uniref:alpha/beta fold hydrolase n=1 Tax=Actinosynnema sp. TaxID=1872144 RepID=UPI003F858AA5
MVGVTPVAGMPGFEHRHTDVDGVRVHHVVGGSGPVVVLLHGWPLTWREWKPVMPLLAAAGRTVVAPDLRGLGDTGRPVSGYTKREVAEDLRGLGLGEVDLVGSDIGAMVAHAWAAAHPAEVRRLVLAVSVRPGYGRAVAAAVQGWWHFGFPALLDLAELLTWGKEAAYLGGVWSRMSPEGVPDAEETLAEYSSPGGMRAGFQHYATLAHDAEVIRAAPPLAMPVLVLNGERGLPQGPLLAGARQAAHDVQADIVPTAAHLLAHGNPEWLAARLLEFLA